MADPQERGSVGSGESKKTEDPSAPPRLKILLLGSSGVGKSSILLRYTEGMFDANIISTAGVDFKVKNIPVDEKIYRLQIWDTAGQERFRTITQAYYRGAMGIILIYDVADERSFADVNYWMQSIEKNAAHTQKILIANKIDIEKRKVSQERGQEFAKRYNIPYLEVSAKANINVDAMFLEIAKNIIADPTFELNKERNGVVLDTQKKNQSCCS